MQAADAILSPRRRVRCTLCDWTGTRSAEDPTSAHCPRESCGAPVELGPGVRGPSRRRLVEVRVRLPGEVADALLVDGGRLADVLRDLATGEAKRRGA